MFTCIHDKCFIISRADYRAHAHASIGYATRLIKSTHNNIACVRTERKPWRKQEKRVNEEEEEEEEEEEDETTYTPPVVYIHSLEICTSRYKQQKMYIFSSLKR